MGGKQGGIKVNSHSLITLGLTDIGLSIVDFVKYQVSGKKILSIAEGKIYFSI